MSHHSPFTLAERTYTQRLRDDERHELAMCGLLDDERYEHEREDYYARFYDFAPSATLTGAPWEGTREEAGTPSLSSSGVPAETSLATRHGGHEAGAGPAVHPCPHGQAGSATTSRRAA